MANMLTVDEAAKRLGVRPSTIRSWLWKRQIEFVKISRSVRIPADVIDRLIVAGTRPALGTESRVTATSNVFAGRSTALLDNESLASKNGED
jgi:excisionase family DNA binding protein